jgi:glyoxylase-like metal-dependent hydrolase (beta-lactamase superfamily II)
MEGLRVDTGGSVQVLRLGSATITIVNVGDVHVRLSDWFGTLRSEVSDRDEALFAQRLRLPIRCVHISLPDTSVLVDASSYEVSPGSSYEIPGYHPPPGLLGQLSRSGIRAEDVAHVVITHGHTDHFNGATVKTGNEFSPSFPCARYHLGRADWEGSIIQEALKNPRSKETRCLGPLWRRGVLDLVQGDFALGSHVQILAAPGETPGHQIVRVHSEGQTLYCLGDLYHHPVEIDRPEWMAHWADAKANRISRRALVDAALREGALLVASHFSSVGRVREVGSNAPECAARGVVGRSGGQGSPVWQGGISYVEEI